MQQQLQSLMETLNSTEPHYIRCVKPNNILKPAIFENQNVIQQLRCGVSSLVIFYLVQSSDVLITLKYKSLAFVFFFKYFFFKIQF